MNYIKHLTGFFEKVAVDKTLNPTHVSLYIALFQFWNCNRFKNPISISRDEVMRISKISSKATYHKCLKNLHLLGYINYEPSYNPFKGSHVYLFNFSDELKPIPKSEKTTIPKNEPVFELVNEQVVNKSYTGTGTTDETSTEQALVSYTNNSNDLKIVNRDEQAKKNKNEDNFLKKETDKKEKKLRKKKKSFSDSPTHLQKNQKNDGKINGVTSSAPSRACHPESSRETRDEKPTIEKVKDYFLNQQFPELEAIKFYNYFSSNGWLVGGKTPMVDWQAAAQNWILNSINFNHNTVPFDRAKHLNTSTDKDYAEPL
jgi:hypothetical protein